MVSVKYLASKSFDYAFFILPGFLSLAIAIALSEINPHIIELSIPLWVIFILLIDVSHVYATIYRVYLFPGEFKRRKILYSVLPIVAYTTTALLYFSSELLFWRMLAYFAVYHFIKQQYGFVALYRAKNQEPHFLARIDKLAIYTATLYPIYYWHTKLPLNFTWFIKNDFIGPLPDYTNIILPLYFFVALIYLASRVWLYAAHRKLNLPKDLFMLATWLNWYVGIIYYNSDVAFTITNVTTHGVCYIALIYATSTKIDYVSEIKNTTLKTFEFLTKHWYRFLIALFLLAYLEEFFWHNFVWFENQEIFGSFYNKPPSRLVLVFLAPLLMLPQITHYLLDGFIWKMGDKNPGLKKFYQ